MNWSKHAALILSVLVLLAGILLFLQADVGVDGPQLAIEQPVQAGQTLHGITYKNGQYVEVIATIDGEPLDGSPDTEMNGLCNEFWFPVPSDAGGKFIRVVAIAADGTRTEEWVHVVP